ncbi:Uncharacterised protein [uncultured archaeon]|nr:Uncharacterised protein [uncultured archaeon]
MAGAANYMYEKASVKGVGYKNVEMIISTQTGFSSTKFVEKESGSGNIVIDKTELEAERQIESHCGVGIIFYPYDKFFNNAGPISSDQLGWNTGWGPMDYINLTKEAEFEYMPVSYQTGTYDQKWMEKLCVQNYAIGAVLTEMYTHAEHLQKTTVAKTRAYDLAIPPSEYGIATDFGERYGLYPPSPCCTGVLEANLNSNVIGVAHIGWISRDLQADGALKGRHAEFGRSIEDLTGVFSIEKFIQLWGNSTCGAISVDWLPCV